MVSALHAAGAGRLTAVSVVAADGAPLVPCGRCRQLLLEHGGAGLPLDADGGPRRLGDLLPEAFTGTDLSDRREGEGEAEAAAGGAAEAGGGGAAEAGGGGAASATEAGAEAAASSTEAGRA